VREKQAKRSAGLDLQRAVLIVNGLQRRSSININLMNFFSWA
jgi:hypothetical protein